MFTLNKVRYCIAVANSTVKKVNFSCIECCRLRGRLEEQKMVNLPACILKETASSTHCRVDMFGLFMVKQKRHISKWYGALFPCMASRAVPIEVNFFLNIDSFILALLRLVAQWEKIRSLYPENGSNFIELKKETEKLKKTCLEMDDRKIQSFWKNKVETGLAGTRTHLLQVIRVGYQSCRFAQEGPLYDHFWKPMEAAWMMNLSWLWWLE